tara:strand:+ start:55 stop:255 length:201 start_codon:yes stop_codon:yes gene_type:complete
MGKKNKKENLEVRQDLMNSLVSSAISAFMDLLGMMLFQRSKVNLRLGVVRATILLSPSMEGTGICR